jgi:hypothetical protein
MGKQRVSEKTLYREGAIFENSCIIHLFFFFLDNAKL